MMRKTSIYTFFVVFIFLLIQPSDAQENKYLKLNEKLSYKIKYGWLKIGDAEVNIDSTFHFFENEPHYLIQFHLRTVPWLRIFANVNLRFESYVSAKTLRPHHASRVVMSGKDSNIQLDQFTFSDSVYVKTYRQEKQETNINVYPKIGPAFTDALSAYMYVRSRELDMTKEEEARLYIANHLYEFKISPDYGFKGKNQKSYQLIFPPIKEFPRDKKNYVTLEKETNIPVEIRLSTDNGNFFFVLDK
ncbi:MAG: DUF3108 domain-containing protein [Cyclobacteriaceae bacterium]